MGSSVLLSLIEFLVYFSICLLFSPWIGLTFSLKWGLIPFILLIITMTHTSFGMFMSLWVARYEDVKIITPFFIQLLMFVSPVGYSTMLVPEAWRGLYSLNPLVGNIELMRWLLCPSSYDVYWPSIVWSAAFSVGAFLLSLFRIIQAEGRLADEI